MVQGFIPSIGLCVNPTFVVRMKTFNTAYYRRRYFQLRNMMKLTSLRQHICKHTSENPLRIELKGGYTIQQPNM